MSYAVFCLQIKNKVPTGSGTSKIQNAKIDKINKDLKEHLITVEDPIEFIHFFFFFNDTATTEIYTLSLHDALPISPTCRARRPARWISRKISSAARRS